MFVAASFFFINKTQANKQIVQLGKLLVGTDLIVIRKTLLDLSRLLFFLLNKVYWSNTQSLFILNLFSVFFENVKPFWNLYLSPTIRLSIFEWNFAKEKLNKQQQKLWFSFFISKLAILIRWDIYSNTSPKKYNYYLFIFNCNKWLP